MDAQQSRRTPGPSGLPPTTAAVVVPARDDAARIALTVLAARAIPDVDLVVVVDDASTDSTARVAEDSGAAVVRHRVRRGRAAALESGAAAVAACDDMERNGGGSGEPELTPRPLLLLAADLGPTAARAQALLGPVLSGEADMAVGVTGGTTLGDSTERCLTRSAFEAALPLARGPKTEPELTAVLMRTGFRVVGVPIEVVHQSPPRRRLRLRRADW